MCSEGELNRTESFYRDRVGSGGLGCGGGVGLLGTIAASPLKAISTGPQDMAALSPPAEKSSAGVSHLSAAQPRLKIRFLLASSQHTFMLNVSVPNRVMSLPGDMERPWTDTLDYLGLLC